MERCPACGARPAPGAPWCGRCLARPEEAAAALIKEADLEGEGRRRRADIPRPDVPTPAKVFTRWGATFGTLGPRAKVAVTVALGPVEPSCEPAAGVSGRTSFGCV